MVFTTSACGDALPDPEPGQNPSAYSGTLVSPDRIDFAIGKVEDIVSEEMDAAGIPGMAVAVVHGGEVALAEGFGVRDVFTGDEVTADTVFPLASVSKPVSATVVAAEIGRSAGSDGDKASDGADAGSDEADAGDQAGDEDGDEDGISWSTPVREHLPWFALSDPVVSERVTVGDLFSHRSGLPDHAGDDLEDLGYDRAAVLHGLRHLPLSEFRTSYAYTNFGLTAAAEAVAVSAGAPWEELAAERVFDPLGMDRTSYSHSDLLERENRVTPHVRQDAAASGETGEAGGTGESGGSWVPADPERNPDAQAPAGGLSSTVSDMATWMAMVLADGQGPGGSQVVASEPLREALTPQVVSSPPQAANDRTGSYGYGFNIGDTSSGRVQWSHSGAFAMGAATAMLMVPSLDLGIITLSNAAPVGAVEAVNARFADLAQYGDPAQDWGTLYREAISPLLDPVGDLVGERQPSDPAPSRPLYELTGTYRNDYFGTIEVRRAAEDELALAIGPESNRTVWPLEHWEDNVFAASPSAENFPAGSRGSVIFDDDDADTTVTLSLLDENGLGTFTRVGGEGGADGDA
ncbi:serine hydrolase [Dietzia sp. NCCP-2495]|nr:serine hydrolase [Dietzia sp. NCCP-2495]